jgi:hypothetical protein
MNVVILSRDLSVSSRISAECARAAVTWHSAMGLGRLDEILSHALVDLIVVDLETLVPQTEHIEAWRKTQPRGVRVLAFGPHVHAERLESAATAGCDLVVTRGRLHRALETWLNDSPFSSKPGENTRGDG